jgi:hypothetical protein
MNGMTSDAGRTTRVGHGNLLNGFSGNFAQITAGVADCSANARRFIRKCERPRAWRLEQSTLARYFWVLLQRFAVLADVEAHDLVFLPHA